MQSGAGRLASWVSPWQVQGSPDKAETLITIHETFQHVVIPARRLDGKLTLAASRGREEKQVTYVLLLSILLEVMSHGVQF